MNSDDPRKKGGRPQRAEGDRAEAGSPQQGATASAVFWVEAPSDAANINPAAAPSGRDDRKGGHPGSHARTQERTENEAAQPIAGDPQSVFWVEPATIVSADKPPVPASPPVKALQPAAMGANPRSLLESSSIGSSREESRQHTDGRPPTLFTPSASPGAVRTKFDMPPVPSNKPPSGSTLSEGTGSGKIRLWMALAVFLIGGIGVVLAGRFAFRSLIAAPTSAGDAGVALPASPPGMNGAQDATPAQLSQCPPGACRNESGVSCPCPHGQQCNHQTGRCECRPQCERDRCGMSDLCGGVCGCPPNLRCDQGYCRCVPQCQAVARPCGPDGCGGDCGQCAGGWQCGSGTCQVINSSAWTLVITRASIPVRYNRNPTTGAQQIADPPDTYFTAQSVAYRSPRVDNSWTPSWNAAVFNFSPDQLRQGVDVVLYDHWSIGSDDLLANCRVAASDEPFLQAALDYPVTCSNQVTLYFSLRLVAR